ncbi:hypothetical protein DOY81_001844 [Sarcophaga bullata]|nr:hypothetical protein DOY81_001844 [Sarcophaga bullata]
MWLTNSNCLTTAATIKAETQTQSQSILSTTLTATTKGCKKYEILTKPLTTTTTTTPTIIINQSIKSCKKSLTTWNTTKATKSAAPVVAEANHTEPASTATTLTISRQNY